MMLISAIIISWWLTKEQNKGHRFRISWSLCNSLFSFVCLPCKFDAEDPRNEWKSLSVQSGQFASHSLLKTKEKLKPEAFPLLLKTQPSS